MFFASNGGNESAWQALLTFIESAARLFGQALVRLVNLLLPGSVQLGEEMIGPLGYLALLTLVLVIFDLVASARRVIWILVGVGWILLILRIVLLALGVQ